MRVVFTTVFPALDVCGYWRVQCVSPKDFEYVVSPTRLPFATDEQAAERAALAFGLDKDTISIMRDVWFDFVDRVVVFSDTPGVEISSVMVLDFFYRITAPAGLSDVMEPLWCVVQEDFDYGIIHGDAQVRANLWAQCRFFVVTQEQFEAALNDQASVLAALLWCVPPVHNVTIPEWFVETYQDDKGPVGEVLRARMKVKKDGGRALEKARNKYLTATFFVGGRRLDF